MKKQLTLLALTLLVTNAQTTEDHYRREDSSKETSQPKLSDFFKARDQKDKDHAQAKRALREEYIQKTSKQRNAHGKKYAEAITQVKLETGGNLYREDMRHINSNAKIQEKYVYKKIERKKAKSKKSLSAKQYNKSKANDQSQTAKALYKEDKEFAKNKFKIRKEYIKSRSKAQKTIR